MCAYFGHTRAAYYKSLAHRKKDSFSESMIVSMVQHERRLQPRLGGKKLYWLLRSDIHWLRPHFGRDKFFALLRKYDLLVECKRKYQKTTNSYHRFHKYSNLIKELNLFRSNEVWASDITYLRTEKGFVYLSLLTDMYSRKIVGWSLSENLSIEGCVKALKKALKANPVRNSLIHHSDRGIQYCCKDYVDILKKNNIEISMTEDNHCYENALAERVNGILKGEYLLDRTFNDFAHAAKACKEAVNLYNTYRPHWSLGLKTPQQVHYAA